jgi:transposase
MELVPIHKRVIGLDIHQAQITACAITEESGGETRSTGAGGLGGGA